MVFDPSQTINQATSGPSVFSPTANNSNLSYGGGFNWGLQPVSGVNYNPNYNPYGSYYNNASSSQQQGSGSPFGLNNFTSLNNFMPSGGYSSPFSGITSGITNPINDFGVGIGFGSGGLSSIPGGLTAAETGFLQSAQVASGATSGVAGSLSASSLSGTLGAAGIGAFAGSFLGKIGGNPTGGSIGGGLGAGVGMAVGGPVGAIIGGLIGGVGGGFFGGGKPTNADFYTGTFSADGGQIVNGARSQKNAGQWAGYGQSVFEDFQNLAKAASKSLGIQYNPDTGIRTGITTRHGGASIRVNDQLFKYDKNDLESLQAAQGQALLELARSSGYTDTARLKQFLENYKPGQQNGAPGIMPARPTGPSQFEQFVAQYKAQQNANAEQPYPEPSPAPVP